MVRMMRQNVKAALQASVGKAVKVTFGGYTENVIVLSVDSDGFVCRSVAADPDEPAAEFWLAYKEVSGIEQER